MSAWFARIGIGRWRSLWKRDGDSGLKGAGTTSDEELGCSKPEETGGEERQWRFLVYMGLSVVVLVVVLLWVASELSGDKATWRPILYAWAGIAVVLCFQAAYAEWMQSRQDKQQKARHKEMVCLLRDISRKLGDRGAGAE